MSNFCQSSSDCQCYFFHLFCTLLASLVFFSTALPRRPASCNALSTIETGPSGSGFPAGGLSGNCFSAILKFFLHLLSCAILSYSLVRTGCTALQREYCTVVNGVPESF